MANRHLLTALEKWILERIFKKAVRQSDCHSTNIEAIYRLLYECARKEFTEDNGPTLDHFMIENFEKSLQCYKASFKQEGRWVNGWR